MLKRPDSPSSTPPRPSRLPARIRLAWAAVGLGLLGMLATARLLTPDPSGFGTHQQLGWRACRSLVLTGRPCPTCGMTTALAWAVRGRLDRAVAIHPGGALLAVCAPPLALGLLRAAIRGKATRWRPLTAVLAVATVVGAVSVAAWTIRIYSGMGS